VAYGCLGSRPCVSRVLCIICIQFSCRIECYSTKASMFFQTALLNACFASRNRMLPEMTISIRSDNADGCLSSWQIKYHNIGSPVQYSQSRIGLKEGGYRYMLVSCSALLCNKVLAVSVALSLLSLVSVIDTHRVFPLC